MPTPEVSESDLCTLVCGLLLFMGWDVLFLVTQFITPWRVSVELQGGPVKPRHSRRLCALPPPRGESAGPSRRMESVQCLFPRLC